VLERFDADVVLLAGDIFDCESNVEIINFVTHVFEKFPNKRFFIACGNHDPLESNTYKKLSCIIPDNVKIFSDNMETVFLPEYNTCIHGISFSGNYSYASLIDGKDISKENIINIMVMHGDFSKNSSYNPITEKLLSGTNMDYIALGHVHGFSGIKSAGSVQYAYPGVFEPGGFDETGECGVIYGAISKEGNSLDFYPSSTRKYHILNIDISHFKSQEEIAECIRGMINIDDLYRIILSGNRNGFMPDIKLLENILAGFYVEIIDKSLFADNILCYEDELSLKGKTAAALTQLKDKYDSEVFEGACNILTNLMCGK